MSDFARFYREQAEAYHRLVSAEDVEGNLGAFLAAQGVGSGQRALDVGAGTGRVTRLLLELGASVTAVEPVAPMLELLRRNLADAFSSRLTSHQADGRALPFESGSFEWATVGWVYGHLRYWESEWRQEIAKGLAELSRVLAPGGRLIVFETLGTGCDSPAAPNQALAEYYRFLEDEWGATRTQLVTDYQFSDAESAAAVLGPFFGPELAERIRQRAWARVPEWTGAWVIDGEGSAGRC